MASPDVSRVINAPGRVCFSPSSLSSAFPHGGTAIGTTRAGKMRHFGAYHPITDEAFGVEVRATVWCGENLALAMVLRECDDDALGLMFPNTATGTTSQHKVVASPGSNRPGLLLAEKAVVLLFSPDDPERVPALLLYKAEPRFEEVTEYDLALNKRLETVVVFTATRDSSDRIWKRGMLKDLSL